MNRYLYTVAVIAAAAAPQLAAQTADPVKLGLVLSKTGPFAEPGTAAANGAQLAIEMAGQKVAGRPIEVIWLDDANPQSSQQNFTRLVEEERVAAVLGGSNSASSLAMAAVARRVKVPLIVVAGAAREITGKECNRYTFRTQLTVPVGVRAIAPLAAEKGRKWYFLSANYALGQDTYNSARAELQKVGGQEAGQDLVPIGTSDFSSYILKIRQAKPDVVIAGMGGNDLNNLLKQWAEYGLRDRIAVASPVITDTAMWAVGPEVAAGIYAKQWHYSDPENSSAEKSFVQAWRAKYGKPPAIEAWQGWMSARMVLAAIEQARSTSGAAIVRALETVKDASDRNPAYYRAWDHQLIHPLVVVRGGPATGEDKFDMLQIVRKVPESSSELDAMYGSPAEVGCSQGEL